MIDERLERAAIALFKASTNWAKTPDRDMVLNLWNMQMDAIRDSFRTKARAVIAELDEPSDMEPPADMGEYADRHREGHHRQYGGTQSAEQDRRG